jgi:AraC-like DNA-binding protein
MRDYERSFTDATGLPLLFRPVDEPLGPLAGRPGVSPFCEHLTSAGASCQYCVELQGRLASQPGSGARSEACFAGLTMSLIPVRVGEALVGHLQTGQIALQRPSREGFARAVAQLGRDQVPVDWATLEVAYFQSPVLDPRQYTALLRLLEVFAQHVSLAAERMAIEQENAEPPLVRDARLHIESHLGEELKLSDVARAAHASPHHFCRVFKRTTGLTFTEYVAYARVAAAKRLLANPHLRVSEIAFEVGFNSLTHFNRSFRAVAGQAPTDFRYAMGVTGLACPDRPAAARRSGRSEERGVRIERNA